MKKKELLLKRLSKCKDNNDHHKGHEEADEALLEYINDEDITEAFDDIIKWYS